jgi:hypothetical protein
MSNKEAVIKEIEQIPEPFLEEVLDFVHFPKNWNSQRKARYFYGQRICVEKRLAETGGGQSVAKFVKGDVVVPFPFSDLTRDDESL